MPRTGEPKPSESSVPGLGRAIASVRAARGWKRGELAKKAGISYPYLSEIENGGKAGSTNAIAKIAGALGVTPADLFTAAENIESGGDVAEVLQASATPPGTRSNQAFVSADSWEALPSAADSGGFMLVTPALRSASAAGLRPPRSLTPPPASVDFEEQLVARVTAQVRAELERWLSAELEPAVRAQVRAALADLGPDEVARIRAEHTDRGH